MLLWSGRVFLYSFQRFTSKYLNAGNQGFDGCFLFNNLGAGTYEKTMGWFFRF